MIPESNEEPIHCALSGKMRRLVPPQKISRKQSQVKTYSEYSICNCDSNLYNFCQDIHSFLSSGDLGYYALSAKDYVVYCSGSSITILSGSSVSEAFSLIFQGEFATSSSNTGKEVNRARADLLMPATPVSLSSVIFSSFWALWGRATAMHIEGVWIWERQGPRCPSLTGDQLPLYHAEKQKGTEFASNSKPCFAHLIYCKTELGKNLPIEASLNIPDYLACMKAECHYLGSIDPSFKFESTPHKQRMLCTSATCNQYASFPTSKNQAADKLDKYGFAASFPQLLRNRWGIPHRMGLCGGGESAANGWGSTAIQKTSAWGTTGANQSSPQNHWGSGGNGPNRSVPPANDSAQAPAMKQTTQNPPQMPNSVNTTTNSEAVTKPVASNGQQPLSSEPQSQQQQAARPTTPQQANASQNSSGASSNSWTQQAASKGLPSSSASSDAQKLQNIKEALLCREGWGGENVNQDIPWDVPVSPEPSKDAATPHWKLIGHNGCELWESNLKNGGAAPPKPQQAPWGPDPRTHYGGTWGEDDESADSSNAWAGASNQPQWSNTSNPPNMWNAQPKKPHEWGQNPSWDEQGPPRTIEGGGGSSDWGNVIKAGGSHPPNHAAPHPVVHPGASHPSNHPGAPHPSNHPGASHPSNHPGASHPSNHPGASHPSNHPGASHPSNHPGASHHSNHPGAPHHSNHPGQHLAQHPPHPTHAAPPATHAQHPHQSAHLPNAGHPGSHPPSHSSVHQSSHPASHGPPHGTHLSPHVGANHIASHIPHVGAQWNGASGKDVKPTGWEENSPPPARRDDGTEYWGNPQQQPPNVSRWRDVPNAHLMGRPGVGGGPQQNRLPGPPLPSVSGKDQRMWGQASRSGSWEEPPHDTGNSVWGDASPSWMSKPKLPQGGAHGNWPDSDLDLPGWNNTNAQKREEIEAAVRNNMTMEESLMDLASRGSTVPVTDAWRTPAAAVMDDHPSSAFTDPNAAAGLQHQRFPPQLVLNPPVPGNNSPLQATWQHIQIAVQAGYLSPQILNQSLTPTTLVLIRALLTHMITLHKLTQQVNLLQSQPGQNRSNHLIPLNIKMKEAKQQIQSLSAQISAQQNAFNKQQSHPQQQQTQQLQQQQQHPSSHQAVHLNPHQAVSGIASHPNNNMMKNSLPDNFMNSFGNINIGNDAPNSSLNQGSKLDQWRIPSSENDSIMINSNFPRAPGKPSFPQSQQNTNIVPLLPPSNNTWAFTPKPTDSDWPVTSSGAPEGSNQSSAGDKMAVGGLDLWPSPQPGQTSYGLDIRPFEPGKPWLVNNIEDDPNATPGSVKNSPLSLGLKLNTISKPSTSSSFSELNNTDPLSGFSLSSSTWSSNPSTGQQSSASPISSESKLGGNSNKSTWSDASASHTSGELWGAAPGTKSRGPPPGMGANGNPPHQNLSGGNGGSSWGGIGRSTSWTGDQQRNPPNSALHSAGSQPWLSAPIPNNWLILKNLTPQIDGSTLKTLCMQHGPLIKFHLILNQGIALVNYVTRDEAIKAQGNLNNCILSNTTILAEFTSDAEVSQFLGQAGPPGTPSASWGGAGPVSTSSSQSSSNKVDSWSTGSLWGTMPSGSSTLWGTPSLSDGDQHRATPSSYLPGDLLTSESM